MTAVVLDASAALDLVLGRPGGELVSTELRSAGRDVWVPELFDLEVASALRKLVARRGLSASRALQALRRVASLPATRVPHRPLLPAIWGLRSNMTVYDAAYVVLAQHHDARLVTADTELAGTPGLGIAVVVV